MFKKIIDWIHWYIIIGFQDNIWWPLFGKEIEPKIEMEGDTLKAHRITFGLTPQQMATMFDVSLKEYKQWEKNGLLAPHDTQGPVMVMIKVIQNLRKEINENKRILEIEFGYKGKI